MSRLLFICGLVLASACSTGLQDDESDVYIAETCIRGCTEVAEACLERSSRDEQFKECLDVDIHCIAVCIEEL